MLTSVVFWNGNQAIRNQARGIAQAKYKELKNLPEHIRKKFLDAAERVALPYWDWASNATIIYGLPPFLTDKKIKV
jgi:hypothetical protein